MIDRKKKQVTIKIAIPSQDLNCFSLLKMPDFHLEKFPFILYRDRKSVGLINIYTKEGFVLINTPFKYEPGNTKRLEIFKDEEENYQLIYSEYDGRSSFLQKVTLPKEFRVALDKLEEEA